jgi:hypothetical protein
VLNGFYKTIAVVLNVNPDAQKTVFPNIIIEDKLIVLGLHFRPQVVSEAYEI